MNELREILIHYALMENATPIPGDREKLLVVMIKRINQWALKKSIITLRDYFDNEYENEQGFIDINLEERLRKAFGDNSA